MTALWLALLAVVVPDAGAPDAGGPDAVVPPDAGAQTDPAPAGDAGATAEVGAPVVLRPPPPAPTATLRGQVLAKGTRSPLVGASIVVDAAAVGETDEQGRFEVAVTPGRHRLQIQHPGHQMLEETVEVAPAMNQRLYRLAPFLSGERYETVIVPPDARASRIVLREEELTNVPGSFGDPFRVLESLPGVSQVAWPLAIYAIRGANPGNTGFFIDGIRIPSLFHFALGPSVIHPYFIKEIQFYPGGYPVQFGRFVSGIVNAVSSTPPTDRLHASIDLRLFDAGALVVTPLNGGKGSLAVAGRIAYTGLIFSALNQDIDWNYGNYQVRFEHRLGPGRFTLFAFGANDHLSVEGAEVPTSADPLSRAGKDQRADLNFHRLDLRWDGGLLGGTLTAGVLGGRESTSTLLEAISPLPLSSMTWTLSPRLRYLRPLAWWADIEGGADWELKDIKPSALRSGVSDNDLFRERKAAAGGAYLGLVLRTRSRWMVAPGMRYEAFWEQGVRRFEPSPRLNVRFRPAGDVWLKGSVGRYVQMPSVALQVPGYEGFGLATYGPQSSIQGSLGVEAPIGDLFTLDVTGFYQRLRLSDLESIFNYDPTGRNLVQMRDGESYGVEFLLRRSLTRRLSGWIAYTLSKSDRLIGYYRVKAAADWDQRHILNLVLGYRFDRGWSASGRVHYNTGRPYPVYQAATYRVDYQRLPPFLQLDLRLDKRFVFDRFVLSAYVEVVNATLSRETYDLKRRPDGSIEEKGLRIVLPSVGIRADF